MADPTSPMGRLMAQFAQHPADAPICVDVNGWDSPGFCAETAKAIAQAFPGRSIVMYDRRGVPVAGVVPHA